MTFKESDPELCKCGGAQTILDGKRIRVTSNWMKRMRRADWERRMQWDPLDHGRTVLSTQVLPEDLQNFEVPMVVLGTDVVCLYPNLDTNKVGDRVREAVLQSDLKWEGIDYMEASRYIALNWSEEQ